MKKKIYIYINILFGREEHILYFIFFYELGIIFTNLVLKWMRTIVENIKHVKKVSARK